MAVAEQIVRFAGDRVYVRALGEGRSVLLINGLGAQTAMWESLEGALSRFGLIEFDAPGTGRSATTLCPVGIPGLASLATRILDELDVTEADVLGYSMGGMVAQQLAAVAPERVRRLVLVASSCGLGGLVGHPLALLNIATPLQYWSRSFDLLTLGPTTGGRARRDGVSMRRHGGLRRRYRTTVRGYFGQLFGLSTWSGLRLMHRIQCPTLVVAGDDDPLVSANALLLASRLPEARVLPATGEGHLLLVDPDTAVLDSVVDFLSAHRHTDSQAWQMATAVTCEAAETAIAATPYQVQPIGLLNAIVREAISMTTFGRTKAPRVTSVTDRPGADR